MKTLHRLATAVLLFCAVTSIAGAGPEELDKGVFLVSTDQIQEGNFNRTVVLLLRYGEGGAIGVIVNRPSPLPVSRLLPDLNVRPGKDVRVWQGGPVEPNRMMFLVNSEDDLNGAVRAFADVHVSTDRELLLKLLRKKKHRGRFKIIAGYAGWAPGQLEAEIRRGGWTVLPADGDSVFTADPFGLWDRFAPDRDV